METIFVPILAGVGLYLLFRIQREKPEKEGLTKTGSRTGCGMGCCGGGQIPPDRNGKLKPSAANKCH